MQVSGSSYEVRKNDDESGARLVIIRNSWASQCRWSRSPLGKKAVYEDIVTQQLRNIISVRLSYFRSLLHFILRIFNLF